MFEVRVGATGDELAALIAENHAALVDRECRVLQLACAWADVHDLDPAGAEYRPLIERACAWGGEGTPAVSEYCALELGTLQATGEVAARLLIGDALDLRHRLPRLWRQVQAGQVRAWQARKVAQATRALSWDAVHEVDEAICGYIGQLPWSRFARLLHAAILQADPAQAAERERRARRERDVYACDGEDGLKTLIARATSGDAAWFMAMVNRLAAILAAEGDPDPVGVRRSKAIGLLAQPARALQLLLDHAGDADEAPHREGEHEEGEHEKGDHQEAESEPDDHTSLDLTPFALDVDPRRLRPTVVLHYHLTDAALGAGHGLVRPEHGDALTLTELRAFLADTGANIRVQPVLDPVDQAPVDRYEVPQRLRASLRLRNLVDAFPFGTSTSGSLDLDHSVPFVAMDEGGPPGQTGLHNLGPFTRRPHRAMTHSTWRRRQPDPGTYLFRSPHGYVYVVTNHGTLGLGDTPYAQQVWTDAAPERVRVPAV